MRESKLRKLVKLVEESDIDELELSKWGTKVRIIRRGAGEKKMTSISEGGGHRSSQVVEVAHREEGERGERPQENFYELKSPMVGTFYRAPAPDAEPYVREGQLVRKGEIICIVEAMKLMNEIESDVTGRVVKALVENSHPVEFAQPLFLVEVAK